MSITIRCGGCRQKLRAPDHILGKDKLCPKCGRLLQIRSKTPPPLPGPRKRTIPLTWAVVGGSACLAFFGLVLLAVFLTTSPSEIPEGSVASASDRAAPMHTARNLEPRLAVRDAKRPKPIPVSDEEEPTGVAEREGAALDVNFLEKPPEQEAQRDPERKLSAQAIFAAASPAVVKISILNDNADEISTGSGLIIEHRALALRESLDASIQFDHFVTQHEMLASKYKNNQTATDDSMALYFRNQRDSTQTVSVLTNYHVIEFAAAAKIRLSDSTGGWVIGVLTENKDADLALINVVLLTGNRPHALTLAESAPPIGSAVYAIGSPRGLQNSLSAGIISGVRDLEKGHQWLQTTTSISPGSSGGPLLSTTGKVVGVTTASLTESQNLNFAVPISAVHHLLEAPFETRELWRGVSFLREMRNAYLQYHILASSHLYQAATHRESDSLPLWEAKGLHEQGKYEDAIKLATSSLLSVPEQLKYLAFYTIAKSHLAMARPQVRNREQATIDELYRPFRNSPHAPLALANLKKAVAEDPDFAPTYALMTDYYVAAGQWREALTASDRLIALVPRCADAYLDRGWILEKLDRDGKALLDYQRAVELNPIDGEAHYKLASTYVGVGDYQSAIQAYHTAMELQFAPYMCQYSIGISFKKLGHYKKAIGSFEQARESAKVTESDTGVFEQWCQREIAECQAMLR